MTSQIEDWDKDKVTGLMRKACLADLRAMGVSLLKLTFIQAEWGHSNRNYARESLQVDMNAQAKAAGFARDFRQHHYLGRADIAVPRAWYCALLPGLTNLLVCRRGLYWSVQNHFRSVWGGFVHTKNINAKKHIDLCFTCYIVGITLIFSIHNMGF